MGRPNPLILAVLDGWGFSPAIEGNAITIARKPTYDMLLRSFPNTSVHTSRPYVGLPEGQTGNSEVGHLNIGTWRVVRMDVTRIDAIITPGAFFRKPGSHGSIQSCKAQHGLHLRNVGEPVGRTIVSRPLPLLLCKSAGRKRRCPAQRFSSRHRPKMNPDS